ncbi:hypothetical protein Psta_2905 [Pirellula staleyi DSM 6068]|uniref:Uncharacterized protein n=1 Tax=Pirellula staleyi (strain ATCC 27377 / DSM 6068 / ICPB 4128) TaxID=530564 RepID=D2R8M9_PIRSD|nr:DUF6263 family protein [Pirellula staleyi]ADB17570.1 hypothetical protein Psta_2905 [Pirellula staleyi DSM 6068]
MMMGHRTTMLGVFFATCCFTLLIIPVTVRAQEPANDVAPSPDPVTLVWKWKAGDTQKIEMITSIKTSVNTAGKVQESTTKITTHLLWKVEATSEKETTLTQSVDRLMMEMRTPELGEVRYDSAAKSRPVGVQAIIADAVQPLLTKKHTLQLTPRGEVTITPIQEEAAAEESPEKATSEKAPSAEAAMAKTILLLPEKPVKIGDQWMQTVLSPGREAAPPLELETTYRLESVKSNPSVAMIKTTSKVNTAAGEGKADTLKIIEEVQSGETNFDIDKGRVQTAAQTNKLTTEKKYRETTIRTTIETSITTKFLEE